MFFTGIEDGFPLYSLIITGVSVANGEVASRVAGLSGQLLRRHYAAERCNLFMLHGPQQRRAQSSGQNSPPIALLWCRGCVEAEAETGVYEPACIFGSRRERSSGRVAGTSLNRAAFPGRIFRHVRWPQLRLLPLIIWRHIG